MLTSEKYRDLAPRQVIPALAEQGTDIASEATAYRLLHKHRLQNHRESKRPGVRRKPDELIASAPNQIYCWDITYLKAHPLENFYYLYMVTDIFSRRIVAARAYEAENDKNAGALFEEVQEAEELAPGQVTLHADNGGAMKGATLERTRERLGIMTSDSRPLVLRQGDPFDSGPRPLTRGRPPPSAARSRHGYWSTVSIFQSTHMAFHALTGC